MAYTPPTPTLKAWACRIGQEFVGYEVAPTRGKAKAALYREARGFDSSLDFTDIGVRLLRGEKAEQLIEVHEDRGKYWRDTRAFARLQAQADAFNERYAVGHPVRVAGCCEEDLWPDGLTITRTPAWATQSSVLVSVKGQAGGMYLKYIQPVSDFAHV